MGVPFDVEVLVADWLAGGRARMNEACHRDAEKAWSAIRILLSPDLTEEQFVELAIGEMESLLSFNGARVIDRVEQEAEGNPRFRFLLRSCWRCGMAQEVWDRLQTARGLHVDPPPDTAGR